MIKKHFLLILFLMAAIGLDQSSAQDADMQKKGLEIMTSGPISGISAATVKACVGGMSHDL